MSSNEILSNERSAQRRVGGMSTPLDLRQPDFITVEQAAEIIGIGRTCAYQLARRAADFGEGTFPAIRFGRQLRVPRRKLEDLTGGPITVVTTNDDEPSTPSHDDNQNTDHPPTDTTVTDLPQHPLPFNK